MTSFIITSTDTKKRHDYIQKYCLQIKINPLDITVIQKDTALKQNANSIGIEEIKNMQKNLFLKPIKSPTKAIIIKDAEFLTTQAQNALLKVLEEPPAHTIIILSSGSKEPFLPTIISRCTIINLEGERQKLSQTEILELTQFIENLPKMSIGEKFKKAEELSKDKEKAVLWTEKIILALREKLVSCHSERNEESNSKILIDQIKSLQKAYTLLKTTNVNPRFLLENTFLSLAN